MGGNIITNLPAWCIEARTCANGFSASVIRRDNETARASVAFNTFKQGIVINSAFPVVSSLTFGGLLTNDINAKIIAGASCEISVNCYKISDAAPVVDLPDVSTLAAVWPEEKKILPYDSNMYAAKLSDKFDIPISKGVYLIVLSLIDTAEIQGQDIPRRLFLRQSINVSGVPADSQAEAFANLSAQISSIVSAVETNTAKVNSMSGQIDAIATAVTAQTTAEGIKLDALKAGLDQLHTDLAGM